MEREFLSFGSQAKLVRCGPLEPSGTNSHGGVPVVDGTAAVKQGTDKGGRETLLSGPDRF
jgi:hypothetical protein